MKVTKKSNAHNLDINRDPDSHSWMQTKPFYIKIPSPLSILGGGGFLSKDLPRFESLIFQTGDSGSHLASLAVRLSDDFNTSFNDVLGQLEDLRLAEWSDQAPPPPSLPPLPPLPRQEAPHTYANYPPQHRTKKSFSDCSDPIYHPGQYAVSRCCSSDNFCILKIPTCPL